MPRSNANYSGTMLRVHATYFSESTSETIVIPFVFIAHQWQLPMPVLFLLMLDSR